MIDTSTASTIMERIRKYREDESVSQSLLKRLLQDPGAPEKAPTLAMDIGSVFDIYLTGEELFNHLYRVETPPKSNSKIEQMATMLEEAEVGSDLSRVNPEFLLQVSRECEYRMNVRNEEKRMNYLMDELQPYLEYLERQKTDKRGIISPEHLDLAREMAVNVRTMFPAIFEGGLKVEYQYPVYCRIINDHIPHTCKGLLDGILYNDTDVPVEIHPEYTLAPDTYACLEFKSMSGPTHTYLSAARRGRHDLQISFYHYMLRTSGKKVAMPISIVESSTEPGRPILYEWSEEDLHIGEHGARRHGGELEICYDDHQWDPEYYIYGWRQALNVYDILQTKGSFSRPANSLNGKLWGRLWH